jgi:trk system potassium uptake protein TrkH
VKPLNVFRVLKTGTPAPPWVKKFKKYVYGVSFLALFFVILQSGLRWHLPRLLVAFTIILDYSVFILYIIDAALNFYFTYPKKSYFLRNWLDVLVFIPFILSIATPRSGVGLIVIRHIVVLIQTFTRTRKFSHLLRGIRFNTAQIIALSFLGTIMLGTILLTFPSATADGKGTPFVDAFFTATSATCVTGLIVRDTPVYFSTFGQIIILALMQLGGLGIMTYSAFLALIFGRFSLGQRRVVQEMMDEERNVLNMIAYIFKMTFTIEAVGALILYARWIMHFKDPAYTIYMSIFHSISAFCNAGFSLFSNSLESFTGDAVINIVITLLIILGGLGFIVVYELSHLRQTPEKRLSTHTRLVLTVSSILIATCFLIFFFLEFDHALLEYPITAKIWGALFQSVTPRTAGFNTVPIASFSAVTLTIMIILMFIGASPGSTGGGIKTSTLAILLLSLKSILKGKEDIEVFNRTISSSIVYKAVALVVGSLLLLASMFLLLLLSENKPFLPLLFETVSAFGTVGLSMGITADLTILGKIFIIVLMFTGRIGPLTLGFALMKGSRARRIRYPDAKVMIG